MGTICWILSTGAGGVSKFVSAVAIHDEILARLRAEWIDSNIAYPYDGVPSPPGKAAGAP